MSYYYISQYQDQVPGINGAAGRIIMPRGVQAITLDRRHGRISGQTSLFNETPPDDHEPALLLDPQLYLAELSCDTCSDVCASLVGYPWFARAELAGYDSGKITQLQYKETIRSQINNLWRGMPTSEADVNAAAAAAIAYQVGIGCDAIILPSPLTTDPGTTYATELEWLDAGLRLHTELAPQARCFATVALSDICTFSAKPETNRLLDLILDQVSARDPWGVYLVLEQRIEPGYYLSSPHTIRTLLQLVTEFKTAGIDRLLVSWMGTAGLLALAAGATGWASGWYRSERRLKLDDLLDDSGGPAKPAFYSHALASELHPADLERVRDAGQLDLVAEPTPWSEGLLRALRDGKKVEDVETWTNHAARAHFNSIAVRETATLKRLDIAQRASQVTTWLQEAQRRAEELAKLGSFHQRTSLTHQATWSSAFASRAKANEG